MSSLNLKRACSTKQTGSPGAPSAPASEISYWLITSRMRWRRTKRSCWLGSVAMSALCQSGRRRALRTRWPRHAGRLVGGAARLVDLSLHNEAVAQAPEPAGRRVDHAADAPCVHAPGAQHAVVELDVLVGLGTQLLPQPGDVGEVGAHHLVAAGGPAAA